MIEAGGGTVNILYADGTSAFFDPEELRLRLEKSFAAAGRTDPVIAGEIVLAVERIGQREATLAESVATVGVIQNTPNALNVVPGAAELGIDLRGSRMDSLDRMERDTLSAARVSVWSKS